ncbi:MAG: hypothetical protein HYV33_05415 [Candidatus Kerfeldbacteria bacterium]|nr:hypothetical protein [Candidatus Kerfeldbacteria bacterium]
MATTRTLIAQAASAGHWWQQPILVWSSLIAGLLQAGQWLALYWFIPPTSDLVPLHYTIYFGVDLVGEWYQLLYMPLSGTVILLLNGILAWHWRQRDIMISYLLLSSTVLLELLLGLAIALIIITQHS